MKGMSSFKHIIVLTALAALTACGSGSEGGSPTFFGGVLGGTLVTINSANDSFTMGDGTYGPNPVVSQTISYDFKMSKHEITNAQFQVFIDDGGYSTDSYWTTNGITERNNGSWTQPANWTDSSLNGANQPVVGVSWYEAVAFTNWLSTKEGLTPAYNSSGQIVNLSANGYRLPIEVEWEYAAAKGQSGASERLWSWGGAIAGDWDCTRTVSNDTGNGCSASQTANVGSISAGDTPQGLSDMSGNVWEWVSDSYQADSGIASGTDWYYFVDDQATTLSIFRGGAWGNDNEAQFRGAFRGGGNLVYRVNYVGFRVVRP